MSLQHCLICETSIQQFTQFCIYLPFIFLETWPSRTEMWGVRPSVGTWTKLPRHAYTEPVHEESRSEYLHEIISNYLPRTFLPYKRKLHDN